MTSYPAPTARPSWPAGQRAARLVINFAIAPQPDGQLLLSTETRVYCPDRASLLRFAPYWALIRPVSGWIRRRMLAGIAQDAQARSQD